MNPIQTVRKKQPIIVQVVVEKNDTSNNDARSGNTKKNHNNDNNVEQQQQYSSTNRINSFVTTPLIQNNNNNNGCDDHIDEQQKNEISSSSFGITNKMKKDEVEKEVDDELLLLSSSSSLLSRLEQINMMKKFLSKHFIIISENTTRATMIRSSDSKNNETNNNNNNTPFMYDDDNDEEHDCVQLQQQLLQSYHDEIQREQYYDCTYHKSYKNTNEQQQQEQQPKSFTYHTSTLLSLDDIDADDNDNNDEKVDTQEHPSTSFSMMIPMGHEIGSSDHHHKNENQNADIVVIVRSLSLLYWKKIATKLLLLWNLLKKKNHDDDTTTNHQHQIQIQQSTMTDFHDTKTTRSIRKKQEHNEEEEKHEHNYYEYEYCSLIIKLCGTYPTLVACFEMMKQYTTTSTTTSSSSTSTKNDSTIQMKSNTIQIIFLCLQQILFSPFNLVLQKQQQQKEKEIDESQQKKYKPPITIHCLLISYLYYCESSTNTTTTTTSASTQQEQPLSSSFSASSSVSVSSVWMYLLELMNMTNTTSTTRRMINEELIHFLLNEFIQSMIMPIPQLISTVCYQINHPRTIHKNNEHHEQQQPNILKIPKCFLSEYYYSNFLSTLFLQSYHVDTSSYDHLENVTSESNTTTTTTRIPIDNEHDTNNKYPMDRVLFCFIQKYVQQLIRTRGINKGCDDIANSIYHSFIRINFKWINNAPKRIIEMNHRKREHQQQQHQSKIQRMVHIQTILWHCCYQNHSFVPKESAYLLRSLLRRILVDYHLYRMEYSTLFKKNGDTQKVVQVPTKTKKSFFKEWLSCCCLHRILSSSSYANITSEFMKLILLSSSSVIVTKNKNNNNNDDEVVVDRTIPYLVSILLLQSGGGGYILHEKSESSDDNDCESDVENVLDSMSMENRKTKNDDDYDGIKLLIQYVTEISLVWSQISFIRQTDYKHQRHITYFLSCSLSLLYIIENDSNNDCETQNWKEKYTTSDFLTNLLSGVTSRLHSTIQTLRLDGMYIAEKLSKLIQTNDDGGGGGNNNNNDDDDGELQFDELNENRSKIQNDEEDDIFYDTFLNPSNDDEIEEDHSTKIGDDRSSVPIQDTTTHTDEQNTSELVQVTNNDTDDEDLDRMNDSVHDDDSVWEEEESGDDENLSTTPYDLVDDEEDLFITSRPLYLNECLDLLRTPEGNENAYSRHVTALKEIVTLIRSRPSDLYDVSAELAVQLLRMENKFSIESYSTMIANALRTLTVEVPDMVGVTLIHEFFAEGSLTDRLNVLQTLSDAALELSGNHHVMNNEGMKDPTTRIQSSERKTTFKLSFLQKMSKDSQGNSTTLSMRNNEKIETVTGVVTNKMGIESRTRRWGNATANRVVVRENILRNDFVSVGPIWFMTLIGQFMEKKESPMWSDEIGATLLANFLITLSYIVECTGRYHPNSQVLAKDLLQFAWSFRTADVPEVRSSVLYSVGTSLGVLHEDITLGLLFGSSASNEMNIIKTLQHISQTDPDDDCRSLSIELSKRILSTVKRMERPLISIMD